MDTIPKIENKQTNIKQPILAPWPNTNFGIFRNLSFSIAYDDVNSLRVLMDGVVAFSIYRPEFESWGGAYLISKIRLNVN